jgi:hypothetical protein
MKKCEHGTVIEICGMRGVAFTAFAVVCLAAGFVAFPAYVLKSAWNYFHFAPAINIYQGMLLWAIIAIMLYMVNSSAVSFKPHAKLTDDELQKIIENIRKKADFGGRDGEA